MRRVGSLIIVISFAMVLPGCSVVKRINQILDGVKSNLKKVGETIDTAKAAATSAGKFQIAKAARVPEVPKTLTDGLPIGTQMEGKEGTWNGDIDGDGDEDSVQVFVTNDPRDVHVMTTGNDPDEVVFVAWQDDDYCFLAFEEDESVWYLFSECESTEGLYICNESSESIVCIACNSEGDCTKPFDPEAEDDVEWPEDDDPGKCDADNECDGTCEWDPDCADDSALCEQDGECNAEYCWFDPDCGEEDLDCEADGNCNEECEADPDCEEEPN